MREKGLPFDKAIALRDTIKARGWPHDLIAVEAFGVNIAKGTAGNGYRVVLAWPEGRFVRVRSLKEAEPALLTA